MCRNMDISIYGTFLYHSIHFIFKIDIINKEFMIHFFNGLIPESTLTHPNGLSKGSPLAVISVLWSLMGYGCHHILTDWREPCGFEGMLWSPCDDEKWGRGDLCPLKHILFLSETHRSILLLKVLFINMIQCAPLL